MEVSTGMNIVHGVLARAYLHKLWRFLSKFRNIFVIDCAVYLTGIGNGWSGCDEERHGTGRI